MKQTKNKIQKLFILLLAVMVTVMSHAALNVANAQGSPRCEDTALGAAFGCGGLLGGEGAINIQSVITLFFRILLFASLLAGAFYFFLGGFQIQQAKNDPEKRKAGIQSAINAVIGFVVAALSFGAINTVSRQFGVSPEVSGAPCIAKTKDGITFTGFLMKDSKTKCVLERPGSANLEGCVDSNKTFPNCD